MSCGMFARVGLPSSQGGLTEPTNWGQTKHPVWNALAVTGQKMARKAVRATPGILFFAREVWVISFRTILAEVLGGLGGGSPTFPSTLVFFLSGSVASATSFL